MRGLTWRGRRGVRMEKAPGPRPERPGKVAHGIASTAFTPRARASTGSWVPARSPEVVPAPSRKALLRTGAIASLAAPGAAG